MAITVSIYLDCRHTSKLQSISKEEPTYPIKIAITKDSSTAYISTGIKLAKSNWKNHKVTGLPDKARLNTHLEGAKAEIMALIFEGRSNGLYYNKTATEIKDDIMNRLDKKKEKTNSVLFLSVYDDFAARRESQRTRDIYRATATKIRKTIPEAERLPIVAVNLDWLEMLDDLLIKRGNNGSTRSLDFRNIRAVLKHAKKHKLIQDNPFDEFTIPSGESPNRALSIEQLRSLRACPVKSWEEKYLDFFFLSFMLIGINTEDLIHLESIENGRINYIRSKTGQSMSVKVEPEALALIEKYKGEKYLLNVLDTYSNTHNWTAKVDSILNDIGRRCGLTKLSMYWARHTWATLANIDLQIDLGTVADALGHQPEKKVTLIYIKKKDFQKTDAANRAVIDYLLGRDDA